MKAENTTKLKLVRTVFSLAILALIWGCAGYRVGSMLPDKYQSIAVPTVVNKTEEPLLQDEITSATISEFQMDGSLRIASEDRADAILNVQLTDFRLRPISYSDERSRMANEYRLYITASILLEDSVTEEVIVEAPAVQGATDFVVQGDLTSSKKSAIPDAARDLAHHIVEKVVEVW